jgi:hypothetical protein|tara:strand:- start:386 stop:718 length:333 start_codon:yes stop_codon:yes gene_type:complete
MENPSNQSKSEQAPEFAIFQDDRRRLSAFWIKAAGRWNVLPKEDFAAISIMANMIRESPDPETTLRHIAQSILEISQGGEEINTELPPPPPPLGPPDFDPSDFDFPDTCE